ncbi:MAG: zinc-binding dehydrogenase, partial [Chloroflexi bacterium]|nr:zinc-binding dehydrogenase [Chloroflexota bacterium]
EEKARLAREAGADEVIVYSKVDFEPEVKRLTNGQGVQVVYDSVGKDTFDRSLNCLARRGMLVLFGQSSGRVAPVDPFTLMAKGSLFLTRPGLGDHVVTREELLQRAGDVLGWVKSGELKVRIDRVFAMVEAGQAQERLTSRQSSGKILLAT